MPRGLIPRLILWVAIATFVSLAHGAEPDLVVVWTTPNCSWCEKGVLAAAPLRHLEGYPIWTASTTTHGESAAEWKITLFPTYQIFGGGLEVARVAGYMDQIKMLAWMKKYRVPQSLTRTRAQDRSQYSQPAPAVGPQCAPGCFSRAGSG